MKKNLVSILAALALVTTVTAQPVLAKTTSNGIKGATSQSTAQVQNIVDTKDGLQLFLFGNLSDSVKPTAVNVISYLKEKLAEFNFSSLNNGFFPTSIKKDDLGFTHVKLQQTYAGKIVYGKTVTVHFNQNGILQGITGSLENRINSIVKEGNSPIDAKEAVSIAKASKNATELTEDTNAKNFIYYKDGKAYDTYRVTVAFETPEVGSYDIFVDRYSKKIVGEENRIKATNVVGSGKAVNGTTRSLNLNYKNSKYYLEDTTKTAKIATYTNKNRTSSWYQTLMYFTSSTINDPAAVSAHSYAGVVYDFYKNVFNRNSIDGNGMTIKSVVHYDRNYDNAFWNGSYMTYGDGDGSEYKAFSGDLDVVAHEMSHGVTSNEGNMNYSNQPGALNESVSDVLGVLCQTYDKYNVKNGGTWQFNSSDWVVGDDLSYTGTPFRSLVNPTLYNQPAHMNNYYNTSQDNGGVHYNSGIPNKAGYLMAQNIGCEKTARIWYRALCTYFNTTTNFSQARAGLVQAAKDLYGTNSAEATATANAFSSVGIN